MPKQYSVDGTLYDIPDEESSEFLKDFPKAEEVQVFVSGKDTYGIPLKEVKEFLKDVPDAKPYGQEEPLPEATINEQGDVSPDVFQSGKYISKSQEKQLDVKGKKRELKTGELDINDVQEATKEEYGNGEGWVAFNENNSNIAQPKEAKYVKTENAFEKFKLFNQSLAEEELKFSEALKIYNQAKETGDEQTLKAILPAIDSASKTAKQLKDKIEGLRPQLKQENKYTYSGELYDGLQAMVGTILGAPSALNNAALIAAADIMGMPKGVSLEPIREAYSKVNPLWGASDRLGKVGAAMIKVAEASGEKKTSGLEYSGSAWEALKNGKPRLAAEYASKSFARSLPQSLTFINPVTATLTGIGMVGDEINKSEDESGVRATTQDVLVGGIKAGLEVATERMFGATKATKELLQSFGKEAAEKMTKEATEELVKRSLGRKVAQTVGEEVVGEVANQIGSNAADIYIKGKNIPLTEGVGDAAIMALFGGVVQGGGSQAAMHYIDKGRIKEAEIKRQEATSLMAQANAIEGVNIPQMPAGGIEAPIQNIVKQTLEDAAAIKTKEADAIIDEQNELSANMHPEAIKEIEALNRQEDEIEAVLPQIQDETSKKALEDKLKELSDKKKSLLEVKTEDAVVERTTTEPQKVIDLKAQKEKLLSQRESGNSIEKAVIDKKIAAIDNQIKELSPKEQSIPEGYRIVNDNETLPAGDYDTHIDITTGRKITNAPPKENSPVEKVAENKQPLAKAVSKNQVKPIRQLGSGANVYFESNKYRVNDDLKNGGILLNVGDENGEIPIANVKFEDANEAVFVAKKLEDARPNGLTQDYNIEKIVSNLKEEYKKTANPEAAKEGDNVKPNSENGKVQEKPNETKGQKEDVLTSAERNGGETKVEPPASTPKVSDAPLKDVESTAKALEGVGENALQIKYPRKAVPTHAMVAVEHAGNEAPKRVTSANKNDIVIDGYGTTPTTSFLSKLIENGRLNKSDFKKGLNIRLTEEYATKLLRENEDLFPANFSETRKISEAYHKAKADGSNPELVKAVEELIDPSKKQPQAKKAEPLATENTAKSSNPELESPTSAIKSENIGGIGGNVKLRPIEKYIGENPKVDNSARNWNEEMFLQEGSDWKDSEVSDVIHETPYKKTYFGGIGSVEAKSEYAVVRDTKFGGRQLLLSREVGKDGKVIRDWSAVGEYDGNNIGILESHRGKGAGAAFVKELIRKDILKPSIGYSPEGLATVKKAYAELSKQHEGRPKASSNIEGYKQAQTTAKEYGYKNPTELLDDVEKQFPDKKFSTVQDAIKDADVKSFLEGKKSPEQEYTKKLKEVAPQITDEQVQAKITIAQQVANTLAKWANVPVKKVWDAINGTLTDKMPRGNGVLKQIKDGNGNTLTVRELPEGLDVVNGFYSPIEKTVRELKSNRWGDGKQAWAELKSKGLKADEVKWTGIEEWLTTQGKVSKQDILDYLKNNRVQLVEVVKGDYSNRNLKKQKVEPFIFNVVDEKTGEVVLKEVSESRAEDFIDNAHDGTNTKFSQYQASGDKSNYREVLVTMPTENKLISEGSGSVVFKGTEQQAKDWLKKNVPEESQQYYTLNRGQVFKSSHFNEPNIIGHLRISNRVDAEGNKVLHISEVQSDWGQKGKKEGFVEPPLKELPKEFKVEHRPYYPESMQWAVVKEDGGRAWTTGATEEEAIENAKRYIPNEGGKIPQAPFVTNTSNWTKLLLKYAIREAVKDGATKVTWESGETQNERYNLAQWAESVNYTNNGDGTYTIYVGKKGEPSVPLVRNESWTLQEIENNLGKDVAARIKNDEGSSVNAFASVKDRDNNNPIKELKGDQLKVGGKGMIGFYGSPTEGKEGIVGKTAKELVKELTGKEGKIGETKIVTGEGKIKSSEFKKWINEKYPNEDADKHFYNDDKLFNEYKKELSDRFTTQHSIDITPELKASVERGMPLFQREGETVKGAADLSKGTTYIGKKGDISTLIHEDLGHHTFATIEKMAEEGIKPAKGAIETLNKFAEGGEGKKFWDRSKQAGEAWAQGEYDAASRDFRHELWSRATEKYLLEGDRAGFSESMNKVLAKVKVWLKQIYEGVKNSPEKIELSPDMRRMFDALYGKEKVDAELGVKESAARQFAIDFVKNDLVESGLGSKEKKFTYIPDANGKKRKVQSNTRKRQTNTNERLDLGMTSEEKNRAIKQIKEGNYEGVAAKQLIKKIAEMHEKDEFPYIQGSGGGTSETSILNRAQQEEFLARRKEHYENQKKAEQNVKKLSPKMKTILEDEKFLQTPESVGDLLSKLEEPKFVEENLKDFLNDFSDEEVAELKNILNDIKDGKASIEFTEYDNGERQATVRLSDRGEKAGKAEEPIKAGRPEAIVAYKIGDKTYKLIDANGLHGIPVEIDGNGKFREISQELYDAAVKYSSREKATPYEGQEKKFQAALDEYKAEYESQLEKDKAISDFSGGAVQPRGRATGDISEIKKPQGSIEGADKDTGGGVEDPSIQKRKAETNAKIAENVDKIISTFDGRKKLTEQEKVNLVKEFKDLIENLVKRGLISLEEAIDYAKEHLRSVRGASEKEVLDIIDRAQKEPVEEPVKQEEVKKTIATVRAYEGEVREGVKKELEKLGLTREVESQKEAKAKAKEFIDNVGEDTALEAVRNNDVSDAAGAYVWNELIERVEKQLATETDPQKISELEKKQAQLFDEFSRKALSGGRFSSALNDIYQNSDLGYNVEKKINEWKDRNNGEISPEVEEKFRELDKQLKQVKADLAKAEERAKKAEEAATIEAIKEAGERDKRKNRYSLTSTEAARKKELSAKYRGRLNDVARVVALIAEKEFREYARLVFKEAKGDFVEFSKELIKVVGKGIKEHIPKLYKDLGGKGDANLAVINKKPSLNKEGRLTISKDLIHDLVEGGIDNIEDLTKEVHRIVKEDLPDVTERQVRDAITEYGKIRNLNSDEIATDIRKMKRIGRIISALEDVNNKKRPLKSGIQRDKLDAQERALNKELREAMKELPLDENTQAEQLKTASDAAKQRLRNQIEDLQREIDKGETTPRSARTVQEDAELKSLKEQRDELKKEHEAIFKDEEFKEQRRLELAKQRVNNRIADLQRRLKEGDFSKRKTKKAIEDDELHKLRAEKLRIQDAYDKAFYKNELENRTKAQKVKDSMWDAWGLTRALSATSEFSFMGVQGLIQSVAHPLNAKEALKNALKFFASEKKTENFLQLVRSQEWYPELKKSKLALTEPSAKISAREEMFFSGWTDVIWNTIGAPLRLKSKSAFERWEKANPFRAIERAAVGYLDTLRVLRFIDGLEVLKKKGISIETDPQAYKDMADVVNTLTGRGSIGFMEKNPELWTKVFFSPRNWASAFKTATPYAFYHFGKMRAGSEGFKPSVAQKMAIADLSKFIGVTTGMVAMVAAATNNDEDDKTGVEFDPRSADFMKIRIGNTRVDPWGGRQQEVVLTARVIADILTSYGVLSGAVKKESGDIMPLGVPYKTPKMGELMIERAFNKLAPSASLAQKYLFSRVKDGDRVDNYGNKLTLSNEMFNRMYPIYYGTIYDLLKDDTTGSALDGFLAFYSFFGGGVQTYTKKNEKPLTGSGAVSGRFKIPTFPKAPQFPNRK